MLHLLPTDVLRYTIFKLLDKPWILSRVCRRLCELCRSLLVAKARTVSYSNGYGYASVGRGLRYRRLSSRLMRVYPSGHAVHRRRVLVKQALTNRDHRFVSFLIEVLDELTNELVVDISRYMRLDVVRAAYEKAPCRGKGLLSMIYYDRYGGYCLDPEVREWARSQLPTHKLTRIAAMNEKRVRRYGQ